MKIITLQDLRLLGPLKKIQSRAREFFTRGDGEGEPGGLKEKERKIGGKQEGQISSLLSCSFPLQEGGERGQLLSPRRLSYPAFTAPVQQECNLRVFSPGQLSLHKEREKKKSNECKRRGERHRQEKISLPSNYVWGRLEGSLCSLSRTR